MFIVHHRKIFYTISGILVGASLAALFAWGLKPSIDFKGGAIQEVSYPQGRPDKAELEKALDPLAVTPAVRPTGETGFIIRMKDLTEAERLSVVRAVSFGETKEVVTERFDSIGPVLGSEAVRKAFWAILMVILCIVIFITIAFRKVSEPIASWKYGIITIVALIHDVIIPAGVFATLGHFSGVEVDTLFVTALLVVLGFSVHDTIVVFDRVRENLKVLKESRDRKHFATIVGESIAQTFTRSVNTSLTTVLALVVLYFVGPSVTQHFSLALLIGIVAGTYSSIFIGSPLLVTVEQWQHKK